MKDLKIKTKIWQGGGDSLVMTIPKKYINNNILVLKKHYLFNVIDTIINFTAMIRVSGNSCVITIPRDFVNHGLLVTGGVYELKVIKCVEVG